MPGVVHEAVVKAFSNAIHDGLKEMTVLVSDWDLATRSMLAGSVERVVSLGSSRIKFSASYCFKIVIRSWVSSF
jgi:hypothetical protein